MRQDGFNYRFNPEACKTCAGRCCRGKSGHIWVGQPEITRISTFLKLNVLDFIHQYLHHTDNRYILQERYVDGEFFCVFFDADQIGCSIYEARPRQCRQFPFWPYFKSHLNELQKECPGVTLKS